MHGDLLDIVLLVALVSSAVSGYRRGFIIGLLSLVGFIGGGVLGTRIAAPISRLLPSLPRPVVGLVVVFLAATLGQVAVSAAGVALRRRVTWRPARALDALLGGVLSVVPVLVVAWLLGRAAVGSPYPGLVRQVNHSRILTAVDRVVPTAFADFFGTFFRLVERGAFPTLFGGIGQERLIPVSPPDPAVLASRAVQVAERDTVKVVGDAPSCSRRIEGSGFLYAPDRIMTNAHVVAGVINPTVQIPGIGVRAATVVLYDPRTDIAVLAVQGVPYAPLRFAGPVGTGASAVVAGYPEDGPFDAVAARVRVRETVRGPDIYDDAQVDRQVYALRAIVRPGNSGGPMLDPSGQVDGVVFAAATGEADTGYALTAAQVAADASRGAGATGAVSTQGCD